MLVGAFCTLGGFSFDFFVRGTNILLTFFRFSCLVLLTFFRFSCLVFPGPGPGSGLGPRPGPRPSGPSRPRAPARGPGPPCPPHQPPQTWQEAPDQPCKSVPRARARPVLGPRARDAGFNMPVPQLFPASLQQKGPAMYFAQQLHASVTRPPGRPLLLLLASGRPPLLLFSSRTPLLSQLTLDPRF